jgi:hypothetical protein
MRRISTLLTVTLALLLIIAEPALAQSIDLSPIQSLLQGIVDALTGPLGVVIATLAVLGVFLSWFARSPVPAEGSRTKSRGVICAAARAAMPIGSGVENCWNRSISSERRVCVGKRPATLATIGSSAAGEPARARSARPNFRRKRTSATSPAS